MSKEYILKRVDKINDRNKLFKKKSIYTFKKQNKIQKMSQANDTVAQRAESNTNLKMLSGVHTGQVKWFNRRRGYGFIKIIQSRENEGDGHESFIGKDVFVHQSHIKPQKSSYRSLEENEYVELGLSVDDKNVTQAVNVTGILGGSLLCDVQHERPVRSGNGNGSGSQDDDGETEGREFRTPKYHQRRNRNYRGYRNQGNHSSRDSAQRESSQTQDSAESSEGGRKGNYFSGLEESH
jgi:cold shock CspA family protein